MIKGPGTTVKEAHYLQTENSNPLNKIRMHDSILMIGRWQIGRRKRRKSGILYRLPEEKMDLENYNFYIYNTYINLIQAKLVTGW